MRGEGRPGRKSMRISPQHSSRRSFAIILLSDRDRDYGRDRRVRKEKKRMIRRFRCELIWKKNDDEDAGTDGELLSFSDHRPVTDDPTSTVLPTDILVRRGVRRNFVIATHI